MWGELYDQADSMGRAQAQLPCSYLATALQPPCNCLAAALQPPTSDSGRLRLRLGRQTQTQPVCTGGLPQLGAGGARRPPHTPATRGQRRRGRCHRGRGSRCRVRRAAARAAARTRCWRGRCRRGCGHTGGRGRPQGEQEQEEEEEALSGRVWAVGPLRSALAPLCSPVAAARALVLCCFLPDTCYTYGSHLVACLIALFSPPTARL